MNALASKTKRILKGKSGETLMEGVVSLLVFSIMMATITMMVMWATRFNSIATTEGGAMQAAANALFGDTAAAPAGENVTLTLAIDGTGTGIPITLRQDPDTGLIAFVPR
jgi:predicted lipid-binding transport protein (Tim44 family)